VIITIYLSLRLVVRRGFRNTYWFNARAVDRNPGQFKAPFNEINNEAR